MDASIVALNVPPFNASAPVPNGSRLLFATCKVPDVKVIAPVKPLLLPPTETVPPAAFSVRAPAPDKPLKEVVPVLVTFNALLLLPNEPALLKVKLLEPAIVAVSPLPTLKLLLPKVAFVKLCSVPPLSASAPVPNALLTLFAS